MLFSGFKSTLYFSASTFRRLGDYELFHKIAFSCSGKDGKAFELGFLNLRINLLVLLSVTRAYDQAVLDRLRLLQFVTVYL